jgi:hypothetical protein
VQIDCSLNGPFQYLAVKTINDFVATSSEEKDAVVLKETNCGIIPNDVPGISAGCRDCVNVLPAVFAGLV